MRTIRLELAVVNNACWVQSVFEAHALDSTVDQRVWFSCATAPPFHPNLVVIAPDTTRHDIEARIAEIAKSPRPAGWSIKDSHARLDLGPLGFTELFAAEWIAHKPAPDRSDWPTAPLVWSRVRTAAELAEWESAWSGDARNPITTGIRRQFPERLLARPEHAFFAGRLNGRLVAGGIANRSPGAVGLSNLFAPDGFEEETWAALLPRIAAAFPDTPVVGYERGRDLALALWVGFEPIGPLRVWSRPG
jgi:hypothetical protein